MDVSEIISMSTDQGQVSSTDYDSPQILGYIHLVVQDYWSFIITGVKSNYNWDTWKVKTGDIVVGQSEYRTPEAASDVEGNLKINSISVCYKGKTNNDGSLLYKKAREVNPDTLANHWNYYANNQSELDPIYFTADRSVFIAPFFSQVVEQGIEIRGIRSIEKWAADTLEKDTGLPYYLHKDIVLGVIPYIKRSEQLDPQVAQAEYERARQLAMERISNKSTGPYIMQYPGYEEEEDTITLSN